MLPVTGRAYDNSLARKLPEWTPEYDFRTAGGHLAENRAYRSKPSREVGAKGHRDGAFGQAPYPVDEF